MSGPYNSLPESKTEYIASLTLGLEYWAIPVAVFMYHAEVPLAEAQKHMNTYIQKVPPHLRG